MMWKQVLSVTYESKTPFSALVSPQEPNLKSIWSSRLAPKWPTHIDNRFPFCKEDKERNKYYHSKRFHLNGLTVLNFVHRRKIYSTFDSFPLLTADIFRRALGLCYQGIQFSIAV